MESQPSTVHHNGKTYLKIKDRSGHYGCLDCSFGGNIDPETGECVTGISEICVDEHIHFIEIGA